MKEMNDNLKQKIRMAHAGLSSCKWSDIYDTEEELIQDMHLSLTVMLRFIKSAVVMNTLPVSVITTKNIIPSRKSSYVS